MRFFLDTEWADTLGSELVSIALVAENGIDYLYAEREILPRVGRDSCKKQPKVS